MPPVCCLHVSPADGYLIWPYEGTISPRRQDAVGLRTEVANLLDSHLTWFVSHWLATPGLEPPCLEYQPDVPFISYLF